MKALGLASRAFNANSPELGNKAKVFYGTALRETNLALHRFEDTKKDSTLQSVVILSYFESFTGNYEQYMKAWRSYVAGYTALIYLRGLGQLQNDDGRMLFLHVSASLITICIRDGVQLPDCISRIFRVTAESMDLPKPLWLICTLWPPITNLYSDLINGRIKGFDAIVDKALQLDAEIAWIFDGANSCWTYEVLTLSPRNDSLPDMPSCCHWYRNTLCARVWTAMRTARIWLQNSILRTMQKASPYTDCYDSFQASIQTKESKALIRRPCLELLATMQQYLEMEQPSATSQRTYTTFGEYEKKSAIERPEEKSRQQTRGDQTPKYCLAAQDEQFISLSSTPVQMLSYLQMEPGTQLVLRAARYYSLVWALTLVANTCIVGDPIHTAACQCLQQLAIRPGFKQAILFANHLKSKDVTSFR